MSGGSTTPKEPERATVESPLNLGSSSNISSSPPAKILKATLSSSLAHLASIRGELLQGWARRNAQTAELEEIAAERQAEMEGGTVPELPSPRRGESSLSPTSANGSENKRHRKINKLHRSVGGRLRDLLSSSGSSSSLAGEDRGHAGDRTSRSSFDGPFRRPDPPRPVAPTNITTNRPLSPKLNDGGNKFPGALSNPVARRPSTTSPRPSLQPRHSLHATRASEYVTPFMASQVAINSQPFESSPDLRLRVDSHLTNAEQGAPRSMAVGGVGGLGAGGDEDELREGAGRKKEGVLWGAGTWEGVGKGGGKSKWESKLLCTGPPYAADHVDFWVVLDRSRIYEVSRSTF